MTRLKDMLEPGETVVHHGNALRALLPALLWLAVLTLFLWAILLADFIEDIPAHPLILPFALLAGLIPAAMVLAFAGRTLGFGEVCVVTDRRILAKRGLFRPHIDELALADIDKAEFNGSVLRLEGAGRTLEIAGRRNGLTAPVLAQFLPRWFPDAGKSMARLSRILEPEEKLVFRYPSPWFDRVLQSLMLCMALFFLWNGYGELTDGDWSGVLFQAMLATIMLWLAYTPPGGRHGWYTAVTDRRLLQHFDWDHSRYEEIPLAEIEADWRSRFAEKLAVRHQDRDLDIPAEGKAAERVLAAIEAAKGAVA